MADFDEGYAKSSGGRGESKELRLLVARLYDAIHATPADLCHIREAIVALMVFLCKPEQRNDENCRTVDIFFVVEDHWSRRWNTLPREYRELLDDIGGALHDTLRAPAVAQNFGSTPEQLLDRARRLEA